MSSFPLTKFKMPLKFDLMFHEISGTHTFALVTSAQHIYRQFTYYVNRASFLHIYRQFTYYVNRAYFLHIYRQFTYYVNRASFLHIYRQFTYYVNKIYIVYLTVNQIYILCKSNYNLQTISILCKSDLHTLFAHKSNLHCL